MKRGMVLVILLLLLLPFTYAVYNDEAQLILKSKELLLEQKATSKVDIDNIKSPLKWLSLTYNYYPKETYRQTLVSENHIPMYQDKSSSEIFFKLENVDDDVTITSTYLVKTKNEYKIIAKSTPFPIDEIPSEVDVYLKETEYFDITPEIRTTASLIASGKNDLFEVSQEVANWVTNNVAYDLSTLTESSSQKASWVLREKQGVCDELSILFIAMMRSLGVPARMAYGISYSNSNLFEQPWNPHAWAEVYFPEYGWVPFDLTYNQFGFIDASHIKFKDSIDVESISAEYEWKGYDFEDADIRINPTEFDISIKSVEGEISEDFDIQTTLHYNSVGFGSYNLLTLDLKNYAPHYISSLLQIILPPEVTIEGGTNLPIYIKPYGEKRYQLLLKVTPNLASQFIYTIPINIYTSYGTVYNDQFSVADKYNYISLDNIEIYMDNQNNDNEKINFECVFSKEAIYLNEHVNLICHLENKGNTILNDGTVCYFYEEEQECRNISLMIGEKLILEKEFSESEAGNKELIAEVTFGDKIMGKDVSSILVKDKPLIKISSISLPSDYEYGEDIDMKLKLLKESDSIPQKMDLRVKINEEFFSWNISSLNQNTDIKIPFSTYIFKPGENTIEVSVIWEDERGSHFHTEKNHQFIVDKISLFDRIKSWWYRLLN